MSEDAADASEVPASATFRLKTKSVFLTFVAGALITSGAVWLLGRVPNWVGGLVFGAGLATMAMAWVRYQYRITFDGQGIHEPRRPTIPWSTVTGCQVHNLAGVGGFEIESTGPQGNVQRIFVSRRLENHREAFRTFLAMARRHDAPWPLVESLEDIERLANDA